VLLGYPPFVKDVVDAGIAQGIDWGAYAVKFVFAGEVFSEEWRGLMMERAGAVSPCFDSASLYGTADGGVLGNETPVSIAIRRILASNPSAARQLFGESRLPTLVQYDPISRFFELVDGKTLAVTGDNGIPLIRYHIADQGGLMGHGEMMDFLKDWGLGSPEDHGVESEKCSLPFVWVFGRADFTVSFYGANVYPENVKIGLEHPEFSNWITGKFVMDVCEEDGCESLHIIVEMVRAVATNESLPDTIAKSIKAHLLRLNSEFANYVPIAKQLPNVELRPHGDPAHFPEGVKHRYTRGR
jgi:phenylacetate-CoA ligase